MPRAKSNTLAQSRVIAQVGGLKRPKISEDERVGSLKTPKVSKEELSRVEGLHSPGVGSDEEGQPPASGVLEAVSLTPRPKLSSLRF